MKSKYEIIIGYLKYVYLMNYHACPSLHGEGLVNTVTYTTHLSQPRRPY